MLAASTKLLSWSAKAFVTCSLKTTEFEQLLGVWLGCPCILFRKGFHGLWDTSGAARKEAFPRELPRSQQYKTKQGSEWAHEQGSWPQHRAQAWRLEQVAWVAALGLCIWPHERGWVPGKDVPFSCHEKIQGKIQIQHAHLFCDVRTGLSAKPGNTFTAGAVSDMYPPNQAQRLTREQAKYRHMSD